MKKLQLLLGTVIVFCASIGSSYAQLSDRINNPSTLKVGTRPIAGNLGISFGISAQDASNIVSNWQNDSIEYETLPITTFKYYSSDDLVFTLGLKYKRKKLHIEGDLDPDNPANLGLVSRKEREVSTEFMVVPGVEKHFLSSNIFDVYVGGRVPLGIVSDIDESNWEDQNDNYSNTKSKKSSLYYGLDILVGMQFFIADLPLALGFELEWSGGGYKSNKTKHEVDYDLGGGATSETYYTTDLETTTYQYSDLNARSFESNTDIRISLNYYFKR
jgi:hypothetical protein